jgi:small subunit ribosomal protein S2
MAQVSLKELLESGAHFGHQTRRWNPKMKQYIFGVRGGVHIIDLTQTNTMLAEATDMIRKTAANGGKILFVGTKRQAQSIVKEEAVKAGMPFVTERWLGGMLTNFALGLFVSKSSKRALRAVSMRVSTTRRRSSTLRTR